MWDLTDDYFPSSAELQVHQHARLRKHGHVHMGIPASVRQNHPLYPHFAPELTKHSFVSFVLTNGGTANLFWGFIVCTIGLLLVYASLAEMASMYVAPFFHLRRRC